MTDYTFHPWPGHPCAGHTCDGCAICRAGGCCGAHAIAAAQQIDSRAELRQALHQEVADGGGTPSLRSLATDQRLLGKTADSASGFHQLPRDDSTPAPGFRPPAAPARVQKGASA